MKENLRTKKQNSSASNDALLPLISTIISILIINMTALNFRTEVQPFYLTILTYNFRSRP